MLSRLALPAFAGFAAGVFWVLFIGLPFVLPSWLSLHDDLREATELAKGHAESFDASETIRGEENTEAVSAVTGERITCDERLTAQENFWRVRLRDELEAMTNETNSVSDRDIRPLDRLLDQSRTVDDG